MYPGEGIPPTPPIAPHLTPNQVNGHCNWVPLGPLHPFGAGEGKGGGIITSASRPTAQTHTHPQQGKQNTAHSNTGKNLQTCRPQRQ